MRINREAGFKRIGIYRWVDTVQNSTPLRAQSNYRYLLCFIYVFCLTQTSFSQNISATIDREKILLGEQVNLQLKAENIIPQTQHLTGWFSVPDTGNHIEVVKRSPIDTLNINGTTSYFQNITLTSFDSGTWQLPPMHIILINEDNKKDSLVTNAITIEVLPVDISALQQYHAMKDIIDVDVQPNYALIVGIIILIVAAVIAIWYFFFRKKEKPQTILQPTAARPLFETAIEQLEKLQRDNPPSPQFYIRLDDICRTYFQNQLFIRALQLTTDELMIQLNVYIQPEERTLFYQLLRLLSTVKFAKYNPEESRKATDISTAKSAIQHIYFHLQRSLQQHVK